MKKDCCTCWPKWAKQENPILEVLITISKSIDILSLHQKPLVPMEVLANEPFENNLGNQYLVAPPKTKRPKKWSIGKGIFTHRILYLSNQLPEWSRKLLAGSANVLKVEEKSWNAFPYIKTSKGNNFLENKQPLTNSIFSHHQTHNMQQFTRSRKKHHQTQPFSSVIDHSNQKNAVSTS